MLLILITELYGALLHLCLRQVPCSPSSAWSQLRHPTCQVFCAALSTSLSLHHVETVMPPKAAVRVNEMWSSVQYGGGHIVKMSSYNVTIHSPSGGNYVPIILTKKPGSSKGKMTYSNPYS